MPYEFVAKAPFEGKDVGHRFSDPADVERFTGMGHVPALIRVWVDEVAPVPASPAEPDTTETKPRGKADPSAK